MVWLVAFVGGALGGALVDQMHVRGDVLSYPHPFIADQAWWVAPQFGVATVLMLVGALPFGRRVPKPSTRRVVTDAIWFVGIYAMSAIVDGHAGLLTVVFVGVWIARLVVRDDRAPVAAFGILLAVVGTIYEGVLAGSGAFSYAHPDVFNVPLWLPGIYLNGAPLAVDLAALLWASTDRATPRPATSDLRRAG